MSYRPFLIIVLLLLAIQQPVFSAEKKCDEDKGLKFLNAQKFEQAFKALESCEYEPGISADVLFGLSQLYSNEKFGLLNKQERQRKIWELIHRSAVLGDPAALKSLVWVYTNGDQVIPLRANPARADCLEELTERQVVNPNEVKMCLSV